VFACLLQPDIPPAEPGSSIGLDDFSLLRVIGRGSYAKVFVVEQKRTKRIYAMKVIKKELVNDDEVCCISIADFS
jgi:atypical protein kinase C iota type